ncbi:tRNA (adenosine(37)-N6)-threonylcarbamoyltransferase complex dimerization subunit type 1 TsaB [Corynebacterium sp.]|uniref:tRNA (adenosine(37)-N6)-threonylcarbamoyltransferase complex dimerization subunit type 1 TsaB n=1 Tax=Corynebacterium sp. TaxID=1720 RepID=UPI002A919800|nr:tRNA (adenosine(37)-N6)-threonylcarbamoyltransferase complex dimerization subunit type 1 TsaB [Corynebacterium sp.]MDY5786552.1 tRNA (adenosine(37)-N6)-threonylcarbamoyltransferase complex dimerization subunit type 1 TsaB [Corynebacterium sp.]
MIVLALDTATTDLIAGVVDSETGETKAESIVETRAHNEQLVPTVQSLLDATGLAFTDIGAVVVGCGPGPFTGLRVGMATASAFGQALGVPVHGVVTHDAVAHALAADSALVVTDARRREVYWAHYVNGRRVAGPEVTAPGAVLIDGDVAVLSVPQHLAKTLNVDARNTVYQSPTPAALVAVADLDSEPAPLVPHYLRRPDAVPPTPKPKSPAIPDVDISAAGSAR